VPSKGAGIIELELDPNGEKDGKRDDGK